MGTQVTENWEQGVNGSSEIYQYKLSIREATKAAWQVNEIEAFSALGRGRSAQRVLRSRDTPP